MPATAEWTLKIAELNDCDRSVRWADGIDALGWNIVTFILRLDRCFNHRTVGLGYRLGHLCALRGHSSISRSPHHIAHQDARRECQNCQRGVKVTPFECDSIFLLHQRLINISRLKN